MATSSQYGAFVPTNFIWDIQQIEQADVNSPEFKLLLVRLYQNLNLIALVLNIKDTGMYEVTETVNGQLFFSNPNNNSSTSVAPAQRQVYRKVINFGALPNAGTKSVPHTITVTPATTFTRIYGAASDTTNLAYIPIPYASPTLANNIEVSVSSTNITVTTGSNRSTYTTSYFVLEYLQQ